MLEDLQVEAAVCGIRVTEFWDLTLKEITLIIEGFKKKEEYELEKRKQSIYNLASLTAAFVSCGMSGKPIPGYSEVFPNTHTTQEEDELALAMYKDQFIAFANHHNKIRQEKKVVENG